MAVRPYNVLGICAGVGGLELGIRIAEPRARGVCYLEREAYAAANLVARMEDGSLHQAAIWSDLTTFDPRRWRGVVHCIASGDPCQPNSVAGKQLGADDDRWLLDHILGIVEAIRPHRFFRENVPGNADGQLEALIPPLERMGYRVAAGIFSAAEVGANHLRERLFIMADRIGDVVGRQHGPGRVPGSTGALEDQVCGDQRKRLRPGFGDGGADVANSALGGFGKFGNETQPRSGGHADGDDSHLDDTAGGNGRLHARRGQEGFGASNAGRRIDNVAHTLGRQQTGGGSECGEAISRRTHDQSARSGSFLADSNLAEFRHLAPTGEQPASEQDHGAGWRESIPLFAPGPNDPRWVEILARAPELEPAVRRMADGMANRVDRLRATGNGVSSLVAAYAWRTLDALLAQKIR